MRANFINESDGNLKIYKYRDGTYSAVRDSILYTFMWNNFTFKVWNFKKIGMIDPKLYPLPAPKSKPHIQMILQVQRNIKKLNEGIESILTPKTKEEISEGLFKEGPGLYAAIIDFGNSTLTSFRTIQNVDDLDKFINELKTDWRSTYDRIQLIKLNNFDRVIDKTYISWHPSHGIDIMGIRNIKVIAKNI